MPKYKVLTDFDEAVDCRTNISHKEGDLISVSDDDVESWAEADYIGEDPVKETKTIEKMTKDELLAYATEHHDIELDGSDKKADLIAQIKELEG